MGLFSWRKRNMLYSLTAVLLGLSFPADAQPQNTELRACRNSYEQMDEAAYQRCLPLAKSRNAIAQTLVGDMYLRGWGDGVPQSAVEAAIWYKRAATLDNSTAKYNLGVLYESGHGVEYNLERAFKWYLSSAKDGNRNAQFNVANMYANGGGIPVDQNAATEWYARAASQGDATAMYNLANRFATATGTDSNGTQAYRWYLSAMEYGYPEKEVRANLTALREVITSDERQRATNLAELWSPKPENPEARHNFNR